VHNEISVPNNIKKTVPKGELKHKKEKIVAKYKIKLVILGDTDVGKTNLINQFIYGKPSHNIIPTISVDFLTKTMKMEDDSYIKAAIYDTPGNDRMNKAVLQYFNI